MRSRMRLFAGHEEPSFAVSSQVTVKLGDVTTLLDEAHRSNRAWLMDFADDEIQVSRDLFEVLTAVRRVHAGT